MSLGITNLAATCWVFTYLWARMESQRIVRVRPAGPSRPIFSYVKGELCFGRAFKGKMVPILEPQSSVCPRFCLEERGLSRVGLPRIGG